MDEQPLLSRTKEIVDQEEIASAASSQGHSSSPHHQDSFKERECNSDVSLLGLANLDLEALREEEEQEVHDDGSLELDPTKPFPTIVWQALTIAILYVIIVVTIFMTTGSFKGHTTSKPIDALYFTVVTLCTVGYGDIVPDSTFTKLFTCVFILVGFGIVETLLNSLVIQICNKQEEAILSTVEENKYQTLFRTYMIDTQKGRMRIRAKVGLATLAVIGCIAIGTITLHFLEDISWVDCFYLSVTSVTTVGYGDYAFTTLKGRCFATVWLLVSTLAVTRSFLYLAELRIDRRNRKFAKWILQKKITMGDWDAADLDHDGSISKSEFIIYKLREMGKIANRDILQITKQFDSMDTSHSGKLTLAVIMKEGH